MADLTADSVESVLRAELAQGDLAMAGVGRVLRHLVAGGDPSLFSQETIASIRGVTRDLARQLLAAWAAEGEVSDTERFIEERQGELARALCQDAGFLTHIHALTLEGQLAARLHARAGIDPILAPLLQDEIAAPDADRVALAMAALAAQARFVQQRRRMEHPLHELPGELFHHALQVLRSYAGKGDPAARKARRALRSAFDEGAGRLALIARLVAGLGPTHTLAVERAGLSVFVTALATASGQERERVILSLGESQAMRLALSLRAAGLRDAEMRAQFLFLHPQSGAPDGFETLPPHRAAAILQGETP